MSFKIYSKQYEKELDDEFSKKIQEAVSKSAVQSRLSKSDNYNNVLNFFNKKEHSKFSSVQEAVNDMMKRSGLISYLEDSNSNSPSIKSKVAEIKNITSNLPDLFLNNKNIKQTLDNYIKNTKGNLPIQAIIERLRDIYYSKISQDDLWEDPKLADYIASQNHELSDDTRDLPMNIGKSDDSTDIISTRDNEKFFGTLEDNS